MKNVVISICLLSIALVSKAQQPHQNDGDRKEKAEAYKIAFITQKLELTPKEAEVFWPVYNEYDMKIKALRDKDRERVKSFKNQVTKPTDQESEKFMTDYFNFRQQELELTRKYVSEFKKVLPAYKVARLITLEQEFKHQLLNKLKEQKGPRD
jgi:hypothetical protein